MHFIKLIRPFNLMIVGLTMYGIGWYFEGIYGPSDQLGIFSLPYTLLVVSTIMIAAAGNIINDYFDVKADRINKPDRLIIGKYVKRRVAIVTHWGINFIAFCIAVYLSWKLETFWYLFIHLLTINLLWYYSMHLKRRFLIGNLLIAALTALVPILVGFYFHQLYNAKTAFRHTLTYFDRFSSLNSVGSGQEKGFSEVVNYFPFVNVSDSNYILWLSFGLAGFAFVLNLAREIVKDMEDVEGDKKLNAKTLPIVLGYAKTKWIAALVLVGSVIGSIVIWILFDELDFISLIPIEFAAILVGLCFFLLAVASDKKMYRRINHLIKLAMVAGLITPIYWKLLLIYG